MVWVLSHLPPSATRPSYADSGWATLEYAVGATTASSELLNITGRDREDGSGATCGAWKLVASDV